MKIELGSRMGEAWADRVDRILRELANVVAVERSPEPPAAAAPGLEAGCTVEFDSPDPIDGHPRTVVACGRGRVFIEDEAGSWSAWDADDFHVTAAAEPEPNDWVQMGGEFGQVSYLKHRGWWGIQVIGESSARRLRRDSFKIIGKASHHEEGGQ